MMVKQIFYTFQGRITACLLVSSFAAALGTSFLWGYNISVMTGPSVFIQAFYNQSHFDQYGEYISETQDLVLWAITIAMLCVGGSVGALLATPISNAIGRRSAILVTCVISIIASIFMGISQRVNIYQFVFVGRFVIGISTGFSTVATPVYLAEISPVRYRGAIGSIHQLGTSLGIFSAQVLGLYPLYTQELWPLLLALNGVLSLIGCTVLLFCPESPRWYIITSGSSGSTEKNEESESLLEYDDIRYNKAKKALKRLRGTDDVNDEIQEMLYERRQEATSSSVGILDILKLKDPMWKWPLIISILLHLSQQLGGINAVMYYTTELFSEANLSEDVIKLATCGTGLVTIITDTITILLVDKLGRRFFLISAYSLMAVATAFLTVTMTANGEVWSVLSIVAVYMFLCGFSPGPGAMTMVIVPEIWTQGPRAAAITISLQFNWWSNFIVGIAFPFMLTGLGGYSFLFFSAFLTMAVIMFYFYVPETKQKTFTEIYSHFKNNNTSIHDNHVEMSG